MPPAPLPRGRTPMVAMMSSSFSPLPRRRPTVRLRDRSPVQAAQQGQEQGWGLSGQQPDGKAAWLPAKRANASRSQHARGHGLHPNRLTQHDVAHARQACQRERAGAQAHCGQWGWGVAVVALVVWQHGGMQQGAQFCLLLPTDMLVG